MNPRTENRQYFTRPPPDIVHEREYGTYLVTQEDLSGGRSTVEIVEAAIAGGDRR